MQFCTAMRSSLFIIPNQGGGDGCGRIYSPYARPSSSSDFFCSGLIGKVSSLVSVDGFPADKQGAQGNSPYVIIYQPRQLPIIPFPHDDMPYVMPLTVDHLEPPNLIRRPPVPNALRIRLHVLPFHVVVPRLQEFVVVDVGQLDPSALGFYFAEDLVFVVAPGVVEGAQLFRAADAAGGDLGDVDVGVVLGGVVDVLGNCEGDGGVGYGFAEEPGYALLGWGVRYEADYSRGSRGRLPFGGCDRNHRRGSCSEGLLGMEETLGLGTCTIVHTPLRSCSVLSGGAAIVTRFGVGYKVRV